MSRLVCPHCGGKLDRWDQPRLTVDVLTSDAQGRVLLVERNQPPAGWALPGGFVDAGESLPAAAARELEEETGLRAEAMEQFHTYSDPHRDPRHHTVTTVFLARVTGELRAGDDAGDARYFPLDALPTLAFDHADILRHWHAFTRTGRRPAC